MTIATDNEAELAALREEVRELRARLARREAEAAAGEPLFAEIQERIQQALQGAGVGTYDLDLETGEGDWSASAFEMLGLAPGVPATYETWRSSIHPDDLGAVVEGHTRALKASGPWSLHYRIVRQDTGEVRWLAAYGRFLEREGRAPRSLGVVIDVSDQKAAEAAASEQGRFLSRICEVTPSLLTIFDVPERKVIWVGGRTEDLIGYSMDEIIAGGPGFAFGLVHPDDVAAVVRRREELTSLRDGELHESECRLRRRDGSYIWILDRTVVFRRASDGSVREVLSAAIDITERKVGEDQQQLMINELNHRVKNTLATVQSIARQTLRRPEAPADFDAFLSRLMALSAAHNVLTRENWRGATLHDVVLEALRPFDWAEERISALGNRAELPSGMAVTLSMALHELATNAAKYGALSNDVGRVSLRWEARDGRIIHLEWREIGGPPVQKPARAGFGSRLLERGVAAELGGRATLEYPETGLVYRLSAEPR